MIYKIERIVKPIPTHTAQEAEDWLNKWAKVGYTLHSIVISDNGALTVVIQHDDSPPVMVPPLPPPIPEGHLVVPTDTLRVLTHGLGQCVESDEEFFAVCTGLRLLGVTP